MDGNGWETYRSRLPSGTSGTLACCCGTGGDPGGAFLGRCCVKMKSVYSCCATWPHLSVQMCAPACIYSPEEIVPLLPLCGRGQGWVRRRNQNSTQCAQNNKKNKKKRKANNPINLETLPPVLPMKQQLYTSSHAPNFLLHVVICFVCTQKPLLYLFSWVLLVFFFVFFRWTLVIFFTI